MMLLRSRNNELDSLRTLYPGFNRAWIMFFGTKPPGIHPVGVFFTEAERAELTREVSGFTDGCRSLDLEPYDPHIHNAVRVEIVHGSINVEEADTNNSGA